MKLYHGSNTIIENIDLAKSKPYKDFGKGFYLTEIREQALRLGQNRANITREGAATVNEYYFDETIMRSGNLNVKEWNDYCEEWAQFVIRNRDHTLPLLQSDFDIVYGPIANDGVNFQLRRYKAGSVTIKELVDELRYSKGITFQYCFLTEKAIAYLKK